MGISKDAPREELWTSEIFLGGNRHTGDGEELTPPGTDQQLNRKLQNTKQRKEPSKEPLRDPTAEQT